MKLKRNYTARYINAIDFDALLSITVAKTLVQFVTKVKYLGIVMSSSMSKQTDQQCDEKNKSCAISLNCADICCRTPSGLGLLWSSLICIVTALLTLI